MENNLVGFILAAGFSKRLKELTKDKPKSFLEINGKKIINYHLDNLSNLGIKKTYIVVGFLKNMFKNLIGKKYKGMEIGYIDNDEFETTGHSYSLFLGQEVFKKNKILLVHADTLCDSDLYKMALHSKFDNVVLIDENYSNLTGSETLIEGENNSVSKLGLGTPEAESTQGVYIGISKFSPDFLTKFCDYMSDFFKKQTRSLNYEIILGKFLEISKEKISYEKLEGKKWININYKEDYEAAQKIAKEFTT